MKLVTSNGGHAIGVYDCDSKDKTKVQKMIHDNRISYYAEADYRKGKALERIVKAIIDQTSSNEAIERLPSDSRDLRMMQKLSIISLALK